MGESCTKCMRLCSPAMLQPLLQLPCCIWTQLCCSHLLTENPIGYNQGLLKRAYLAVGWAWPNLATTETGHICIVTDSTLSRTGQAAKDEAKIRHYSQCDICDVMLMI